MKAQVRLIGYAMALALILAVPAQAQHRGVVRNNLPRANQGQIPPGPQRHARTGAPESERMDDGRVNSMPHVNHNRWFGHDRPDDPRFRLASPNAHGRFANVGASFRYSVLRVDLSHHRFWLPGGFFFDVAAWDWPLCSDWCWDCGDDFVIYADPDHLGWYVIYNVHTGVYVHASYMGQ